MGFEKPTKHHCLRHEPKRSYQFDWKRPRKDGHIKSNFPQRTTIAVTPLSWDLKSPDSKIPPCSLAGLPLPQGAGVCQAPGRLAGRSEGMFTVTLVTTTKLQSGYAKRRVLSGHRPVEKYCKIEKFTGVIFSIWYSILHINWYASNILPVSSRAIGLGKNKTRSI